MSLKAIGFLIQKQINLFFLEMFLMKWLHGNGKMMSCRLLQELYLLDLQLLHLLLFLLLIETQKKELHKSTLKVMIHILILQGGIAPNWYLYFN